jgi:hypothetical protein
MDVPVEPPVVNQTAVVATSETSLWQASLTTIPTADVRPGKMWKVTAAGIMSYASTGTLILTPRWGTTTGGNPFGPNSTALTNAGATTNQPWWLEFMVTCRAIGLTGAFSTFIGHGLFFSNTTFNGTTAQPPCAFGGTIVTTGDPAAGGLFIGWTLSVAGTVTTQQVAMQSLN